MPRNTPWIILLCKFSDDPGTSPLRTIADYSAFFAGTDPDSVPSFWRDASYGELDLVTGTEMSSWLRLPQKRSDHKGLATRNDLIGWARDAGRKAGVDFSRFYGVAAFFSVATDLFGSDQNGPHVVCDLLSSPAQILQEYGHAYGLQHSRSVAVPVDYENPFCVMSGMRFGAGINVFIGADPTFPSRWGQSGPGLCSPYAIASGWLSGSRVKAIAGDGKRPAPTIVELSALGDQRPTSPQAALLDFTTPQNVRCSIEYRHGGWDRGIDYNPIVVQQLRPDGRAYFAGLIRPPKHGAASAQLPLVPPGKWYVDGQFDFSIEFLALSSDESTVRLRIDAAAAGKTLSVRAVALSALGLSGSFSISNQLLTQRSQPLRERLVELSD